MTQKEKLIKAFMTFQQIKNNAQSLDIEAKDYDVKFHKNYTKSIIEKCDEIIKLFK